MSVEDRWRWHAYDHGWRRVMLADFGTTSAINPDGEWFNLAGVQQAERFLREHFHKPKPEAWPKPSSPEAVRTDCRKIPAHQLTDAERDELEPLIARMSSQWRAIVAGIVAKGKQAFAERHTRHRQAAEIAAPKGFERTSPERMRELNERLGYRDTTHSVDSHADPL